MVRLNSAAGSRWWAPAMAILALALSVEAAEVARYDNYRLYRVTPHSEAQLRSVAAMEQASDSLIFLETARKLGDRFDIVVAPHKLADFTETLESDYIPHELIEQNVQRAFDEERVRLTNKRAKGPFDWNDYHTLEEIHAWLDQLASEHPKEVELLDAGRSHQNRTMKGVKLSYGPGRPGVFLEGGIHAREWISPATVTYILNQLLTSEDAKVRALAEKFDWYVFPNANPDGYAYTFQVNRLWRKTRKAYGPFCYGADPNRNWDFHWAEQGTSNNACSDTYHGSEAFSEVETRSLAAFVEKLRGKLGAYIAFHSYSQLLLFPYGHTGEHSPNHKDLDEIAEATVKSLAKRYGTQYKYGNVYDAIYPASGSSVDWSYGAQDVKIAYTYELRPDGNAWNGFVLPPNEIVPTGEETLDSLITLLEESSARGYYDEKH
ncbi:zinc carboxypeptidase A 1 [Anopheles merus]|uniref:Zinc carboxypeptidase A 1 n=1 Tax=Anopheles merus TaxID=30066 RepID=A0A182VNT5_ANOME|nr:zinc carboxypeptidase A 1 [Anopheles merus]XP_041786924.1 zinc carboxypeptidase A 1 [Anopheles merus]